MARGVAAEEGLWRRAGLVALLGSCRAMNPHSPFPDPHSRRPDSDRSHAAAARKGHAHNMMRRKNARANKPTPWLATKILIGTESPSSSRIASCVAHRLQCFQVSPEPDLSGLAAATVPPCPPHSGGEPTRAGELRRAQGLIASRRF